MIQWILAHPFLSAAALWVVLICLILFLLWRRGSTRIDRPEAVEDRVSLTASLMSLGLVKRVEMRPRFLPKPHDPARSEMLAAQILADQAGAHEAAGRVVHAPAPGDRHYREPVRTIRVSVGKWTICLRRGSTTRIVEARGDGMDIPSYPVPEEWGEIITTLAFEVQRLREGWSVDEPA